MRGHYDYTNIYITPAQEPRAVYYENTRKILQTPHHPSLPTDVESHFELPKLTVYNKNERFDVHRDSIHPQSTSRHHQQRGRLPYANGTYSNRLITMLMYLNDVKEGGATVFPSLNLSVNPKAGACLVFFPCTGCIPTPDARTTHSAEKVVDGQKRVLQQWVWSCPYEAHKDLGSNDIQHGLWWIETRRCQRKKRLSRKAKHNRHLSKKH